MTSGFRNFDWVLFGGLMVLAAASLLSLASSDINFFWRQLFWYILAFLLILGGLRIDWRTLTSHNALRQGLYWFSVILLVFSNLQGGTIRGVKSWLSFGGFSFEPIELAKVALILLLAGFFSKRYIAAWLGKNILLSSFYSILPAFLVVIQPDFGGALVIMSIWFGFLVVSGVNKKRLLVGLVLVAVLMGLLWFSFLKPYQKDRIIGFFNPEADPLGINYNVIQSKIAIGSAGFLGKGFGGGTQTQLNFLPEAETDFIFAAFVEEWGIFGGIVVILTFFVVIFRIIAIGRGAKNNDSKFIVLGTALLLFIQFFINIGSNLGLLPVTGINFPYLSYGGSSLLTIAVLVSIIQRIKLESS